MREEFGEFLLNTLLKLYPDLVSKARSRIGRDPFRLLVVTMLSQVTSRQNLVKAVENLDKRVGISPEKIAQAPLKEIEEAIKPAGLYRQRARKIKSLAQIVLEKYGGDLSFIANLDTERARKVLLSLPGVGEKTADVVLLFCFNRGVMPVDTHIWRISKRLGLAKANSKYREIREILEKIFPREYMAFAHIALIEFGRQICRARKPKCDSCPLREQCPKRGVSDQKLDHSSHGEFSHHPTINK